MSTPLELTVRARLEQAQALLQAQGQKQTQDLARQYQTFASSAAAKATAAGSAAAEPPKAARSDGAASQSAPLPSQSQQLDSLATGGALDAGSVSHNEALARLQLAAPALRGEPFLPVPGLINPSGSAVWALQHGDTLLSSHGAGHGGQWVPGVIRADALRGGENDIARLCVREGRLEFRSRDDLAPDAHADDNAGVNSAAAAAAAATATAAGMAVVVDTGVLPGAQAPAPAPAPAPPQMPGEAAAVAGAKDGEFFVLCRVRVGVPQWLSARSFEQLSACATGAPGSGSGIAVPPLSPGYHTFAHSVDVEPALAAGGNYHTQCCRYLVTDASRVVATHVVRWGGAQRDASLGGGSDGVGRVSPLAQQRERSRSRAQTLAARMSRADVRFHFYDTRLQMPLTLRDTMEGSHALAGADAGAGKTTNVHTLVPFRQEYARARANMAREASARAAERGVVRRMLRQLEQRLQCLQSRYGELEAEIYQALRAALLQVHGLALRATQVIGADNAPALDELRVNRQAQRLFSQAVDATTAAVSRTDGERNDNGTMWAHKRAEHAVRLWRDYARFHQSLEPSANADATVHAAPSALAVQVRGSIDLLRGRVGAGGARKAQLPSKRQIDVQESERRPQGTAQAQRSQRASVSEPQVTPRVRGWIQVRQKQQRWQRRYLMLEQASTPDSTGPTSGRLQVLSGLSANGDGTAPTVTASIDTRCIGVRHAAGGDKAALFDVVVGPGGLHAHENGGDDDDAEEMQRQRESIFQFRATDARAAQEWVARLRGAARLARRSYCQHEGSIFAGSIAQRELELLRRAVAPIPDSSGDGGDAGGDHRCQLLGLLCARCPAAGSLPATLAPLLADAFSTTAGGSERLLRVALAHEVNTAPSLGTLFRSGSLAKLVAKEYFTRGGGEKFVARALSRTAMHVSRYPCDCELDVSRMAPQLAAHRQRSRYGASAGEDDDEDEDAVDDETLMRDLVEVNARHLTRVASSLLEDVLASARFMPRPVRVLLVTLVSVVDERFAGQGRSFAATFALMYFYCPALVRPATTWSEWSFGDVARRSLVLAAKLLMSLAASVLQGAGPGGSAGAGGAGVRQPYLARVASFATDNRGAMPMFAHEVERQHTADASARGRDGTGAAAESELVDVDGGVDEEAVDGERLACALVQLREIVQGSLPRVLEDMPALLPLFGALDARLHAYGPDGIVSGELGAGVRGALFPLLPPVVVAEDAIVNDDDDETCEELGGRAQ